MQRLIDGYISRIRDGYRASEDLQSAPAAARSVQHYLDVHHIFALQRGPHTDASSAVPTLTVVPAYVFVTFPESLASAYTCCCAQARVN